MEVQMRQTYANAKRLLGLYATLDNVVEEVLYVTLERERFSIGRLFLILVGRST
jgi:hypothetical protein